MTFKRILDIIAIIAVGFMVVVAGLALILAIQDRLSVNPGQAKAPDSLVIALFSSIIPGFLGLIWAWARLPTILSWKTDDNVTNWEIKAAHIKTTIFVLLIGVMCTKILFRCST